MTSIKGYPFPRSTGQRFSGALWTSSAICTINSASPMPSFVSDHSTTGHPLVLRVDASRTSFPTSATASASWASECSSTSHRLASTRRRRQVRRSTRAGRLGLLLPPRGVDRLLIASAGSIEFENDHPLIRTVRLRPGLVVCPSASTNRWRMQLLRRLFDIAVGRRRGPLVPNVEPLSIQCLHISDLVDALCLVLTHSVSGIFNIAAEPITSELLAARLGARLTKSTRSIRIPPATF